MAAQFDDGVERGDLRRRRFDGVPVGDVDRRPRQRVRLHRGPMSQQITLQPSARNRSAHALPMPERAPVIRAVCSRSGISPQSRTGCSGRDGRSVSCSRLSATVRSSAPRSTSASRSTVSRRDRARDAEAGGEADRKRLEVDRRFGVEQRAVDGVACPPRRARRRREDLVRRRRDGVRSVLRVRPPVASRRSAAARTLRILRARSGGTAG